MLSRKLLPPLALSIALLVACSPSAPLVSSPSEEWEADAERGRVPIPQPYPTPYQRPMEESVGSEPDETRGKALETALADIVGFPFRAAGWLVQKLL